MNPEVAPNRLAEAKALLAAFREENDKFITGDTIEMPAPQPDYPQWAGRLANRLQDLIAMIEQERS